MNEKRYKILLKSHHGIHKNGKIIAVGRDTILSEDEEKYYISIYSDGLIDADELEKFPISDMQPVEMKDRITDWGIEVENFKRFFYEHPMHAWPSRKIAEYLGTNIATIETIITHLGDFTEPCYRLRELDYIKPKLNLQKED